MRKKLFLNSSLHLSFINKKMMLKLLLLCLMILPLKSFYAKNKIEINDQFQQIVTGTVSDSDGVIPGVSILVKGTSKGTSTNFDGRYSINVTDANTILVFSSIGYKTVEVKVGDKSTVNVTLEADVSNLDEVVVVGYTSKKRGETTGSISTLKAEQIENTSNREIAKSLAGRTTGVIVSDRGGYPGSNGDVSILIRGQATLNNNAPLILIDGVQSGIGTFNQLAPQDIANLSILKDGAAAIYGNRAANGVIIVTTKRGKLGKPKINVSTSYSVASFSAFPNLMSSNQYAIYENEIADRNGRALPFTQTDIDKYAAGNDPINFPNTDWAALTFAKNAPETRNSLSISGGNESVKYFVSGDLLSREGMFASGDLNFDQSQLRSNLDIKVTDNLKVSLDLSGRFAKSVEPGVDAGFIYKHIYTNLPTEVGLYANGLPGWGGENGANPRVMSSSESGFQKRDNNDLRARFAVDWKLDNVLEGLKFNGYVGLRKQNYDQTNWYTPWTIYRLDQSTGDYNPETGFSQRGQQRILREDFWKFDETLINATLRYYTTFNDIHSINTFVGFEQQTSETRNFWTQKQNFPTPDHPYLFAGGSEGQIANGSASEAALLSYFASFSYDYDKKYFLDLTYRRDGSSIFGPGNRFGNFYSIGANWAIHKENFLKDASWLNALNLKGSYSVMGNDRIGAFQWLTRYNFSNTNPNNARPNFYVLGETGTTFGGFRSANVPNPNVTWETAYKKNLGVTFTMLDNRLSGEVNYFHEKREGILVPNSGEVADFTGIQLPSENLGKVNSYGVELTLGWADKIGDVSYNLGFNLTQAKNKVIYFPQPVNTPDALKLEGSPIGSYIVYPTNGIFKDQAEVDAAPAILPGTIEGEPYYVDSNEDGLIDDADRIRKATSNVPETQYGFTGGINYKNFNFNFLLQGQADAEVLVFFDQNGAKPQYVFDERWTPSNRNSRYPRAFELNDTYSGNQSGNVDNFQGADFWLHDASFLRLKEIELGYTLTKDKTSFADIKIFARGFNLLTMFSDVQKLGLDPEATGYNNFRGATYPSLKMYTFGLNFSF